MGNVKIDKKFENLANKAVQLIENRFRVFGWTALTLIFNRERSLLQNRLFQTPGRLGRRGRTRHQPVQRPRRWYCLWRMGSGLNAALRRRADGGLCGGQHGLVSNLAPGRPGVARPGHHQPIGPANGHHAKHVQSGGQLGVDSLTKQSQTSRSNVSHLVVDVLLQDCG